MFPTLKKFAKVELTSLTNIVRRVCLAVVNLTRCIWMYRSTAAQQHSLLQTIAMAARCRIPIEDAIRALAVDETGFHKVRIERLSRHLDEGTPLIAALEKVPAVLPDAARSQLQYGVESGTLAQSAKDAIRAFGDQPHAAFRAWRKSLKHLVFVLFIAFWIVTFVMLKIAPTFRTIFDDFELSLPRSTQSCISFCDSFGNIFPLVLLILLCLFLWTRFGDPIRMLRRSFLSRIFGRFVDFETPHLLRQIAATREAGKPLAGSLATLARCHHIPWMRRKLLRVWNTVQQDGEAWSALQQQGLITADEAQVLHASETLNNTPWALRQLATTRLSKSTSRMNAASRLLPPLLMIPLAIAIAFFAVGMMSSLTHLIGNLS